MANFHHQKPYLVNNIALACGCARLCDTLAQQIQYIWQRVAEDFAPFDVDVTTQVPPPEALTRTSSTDTVFGTTVCWHCHGSHGVIMMPCSLRGLMGHWHGHGYSESQLGSSSCGNASSLLHISTHLHIEARALRGWATQPPSRSP